MSIVFGRKSVSARKTPRLTVSENSMISTNGNTCMIYLSEFALSKFRDNKVIRIRIVFKGTYEAKTINNYSLVDIQMDDFRILSNRLCCLCKLARVG